MSLKPGLPDKKRKVMEMDNQIFVMDHPLIQHKLTFLRDKNTGTKEFRALVSEIATLMCYEATRDLPLENVEIETPMCRATTKVIAGRKLAFVPILRAGLGMVDGMLQLVPSAKVGHIGLYRDHETHLPVEYYNKLPPDIEERDVIVLDPMLATGGSAIDAIEIVKRSRPKSIKFLCIIAAPEGLKALSEAHPDVHIYCASVDERLNEDCLSCRVSATPATVSSARNKKLSGACGNWAAAPFRGVCIGK